MEISDKVKKATIDYIQKTRNGNNEQRKEVKNLADDNFIWMCDEYANTANRDEELVKLQTKYELAKRAIDYKVENDLTFSVYTSDGNGEDDDGDMDYSEDVYQESLEHQKTWPKKKNELVDKLKKLQSHNPISRLFLSSKIDLLKTEIENKDELFKHMKYVDIFLKLQEKYGEDLNTYANSFEKPIREKLNLIAKKVFEENLDKYPYCLCKERNFGLWLSSSTENKNFFPEPLTDLINEGHKEIKELLNVKGDLEGKKSIKSNSR